MYGQENRNANRNMALMLDIAHIVTGVVIVILAVLSFLNPEDNMLLFPIIFLLAAALNLVNGVHKFLRGGRDRKKRMSAMLILLFGMLLLVLAIISAVSIWWG